MTNGQNSATDTVTAAIATENIATSAKCAYQVPKLKVPAGNQSQASGIELDTSLTSLGWLQNMTIGAAGPGGFGGGGKVGGHQVERRKTYRSIPSSSARPPHPKSAPGQKNISTAKMSARPNSAPMIGNRVGAKNTPSTSNRGNTRVTMVPSQLVSNEDENGDQITSPGIASNVTVAGAGASSGAKGASETNTIVASQSHAPTRALSKSKDKEDHQRPNYTYAILVHMALNDMKERSGSIIEICQWLIKQYPYFEKKSGNTNWLEVIKNNLKTVGHATYCKETDKWVLNEQFVELYKSPASMKKRGPKGPKKNKIRSHSVSSLETDAECDLRYPSAGNLQLSKSQTSPITAPKGKQPKTKRMKRSNSVGYPTVSSLIPKNHVVKRNYTVLPDAGSVVADILARKDGLPDSFDWASMIKLNVNDVPTMADMLTPTGGILSEMIRNEQTGVFEDFPSVLTDMEVPFVNPQESGISGLLNNAAAPTSGAASNSDVAMSEGGFETLMDSNLLTSDWTVAF